MRITFTQKFHTPLLRGCVKINSPFRRTEFGKGSEQSIQIRVTNAVEFILILGLRWSLNESDADSSFGSEHAWRELSDRMLFESSGIVETELNKPSIPRTSDGVAMERHKLFLRRTGSECY